MQSSLTLEPDTLWFKVKHCTKQGIESGALQSIPTDSEFLETQGMRFLVRILSNLVRKQKAKQSEAKKTQKSGQEFNPFLPYERDLFVTDISPTHVCLLNKFNVVDYHLLLVTREFEDQEMLLTLADFEAMWGCLQQFDGLGFYNGGKEAGASQRHKHLQLVPLPIAAEGPRIPLEAAIMSATVIDGVGKIAAFPFDCAVSFFDPDLFNHPLEAAQISLKSYFQLLATVGLKAEETSPKQAGPYNLLMTRNWMLIVPRSQENFESISINSLAFAGSLFVRNAQEMELLQSAGPLKILETVGRSPRC
ncbi:ATP adenylyltransferase family protein [Laspinema olomoucense]|uniref:ATP adenylyltransferase family protein n=1 Tax=Laspinema olomoucense TaxID=3231600 RepID=UPI0021BBB69A|nr:phosphorylase [Laspinema sp. D3c]MCT7996929.1 phosphorylase [Laspinema sp. D3c]